MHKEAYPKNTALCIYVRYADHDDSPAVVVIKVHAFAYLASRNGEEDGAAARVARLLVVLERDAAFNLPHLEKKRNQNENPRT